MISALISIGRQFAVHPLTRGAQLGAWRRFLTWQIKSRLHEEVVMPWIGGRVLAMRRGMTGATGNLYVGLHEFMAMGLMLHFLREGDLFIDAGANVGTYTVLASGVCGARTLAVEADAKTGEQLARNVDVNHIANPVVIKLVALGASEGTALFTTSFGAMNKVVSAEGPGVRPVRQATLDSLVGTACPTALKLDVEGHEEQVLQGAGQLFGKPSLKVVELEGTTPYILGVLESHGFERGFYDPFTRMLGRTPNKLAYDDGDWTPSNEFYIRDWKFVEQRVMSAKPIDVLGRPL
jgi:FkbM family methyltransferase